MAPPPRSRLRPWVYLALALGPLLMPGDVRAQSTQKVSVDAAGNEVLYSCFLPSISGDGRFVAFSHDQVFVRDLRTGITTLESQSTAGVVANGFSGTDPWG